MYLLSQMWIYLLGAAAVGALAGLVVRRACAPAVDTAFLPTVAAAAPLPEGRPVADDPAQVLADRDADLSRVQAWLENEQDQRLDAEKRVAAWMAAATDSEAQRALALQAQARAEQELAEARRALEQAQGAAQALGAAQAGQEAAREAAAQAQATVRALQADLARLQAERDEVHARLQAQGAASAHSAQSLRDQGQAQSQALTQAQHELRQQRQQLLALKEEHALQLAQRARELASLAERLRGAEAQARATASDELGLRAQLEELLAARASLGERQLQLQRALDVARADLDTQRQAAQDLAARLEAAEQAREALAADLAALRATRPTPADEAEGHSETPLNGIAAPAPGADPSESPLMAELLQLRAELQHLRARRPRQRGGEALSPDGAAAILAGQLERRVLAAGEGRQPVAVELAEGEQPDDLRDIDGIGPANERWLHSIGIYHFRQIAAWSPEEVAWVARHMPRFGSRVVREDWVAQSARLAEQTRLEV